MSKGAKQTGRRGRRGEETAEHEELTLAEVKRALQQKKGRREE